MHTWRRQSYSPRRNSIHLTPTSTRVLCIKCAGLDVAINLAAILGAPPDGVAATQLLYRGSSTSRRAASMPLCMPLVVLRTALQVPPYGAHCEDNSHEHEHTNSGNQGDGERRPLPVVCIDGLADMVVELASAVVSVGDGCTTSTNVMACC